MWYTTKSELVARHGSDPVMVMSPTKEQRELNFGYQVWDLAFEYLVFFDIEERYECAIYGCYLEGKDAYVEDNDNRWPLAEMIRRTTGQ